MTKSNRSSLYDIWTNISNKDIATPVKRSNIKRHKLCPFVKTRSLNSRLFSQLCNEYDAPNNASYFTLVRWLSREIKTCFFSFMVNYFKKNIFYIRKQDCSLKHFSVIKDKSELQTITYLVDIIVVLNELNLSLQGGQCNMP